MKEKQNAIYYITADGFAAARNSPHLEIFRKLGVEVLLLHDRIDEWVVSSLTEFDGKPLQSIAKGGLDLSALGDEAAKKEEEQQAEEHKGLVERMQKALSDRASAVRVTHRLTDSPACLVSDEHGMSTNLERMLKAAGQNVPTLKPVLEINPGHPIVRRLNDETDDSTIRRLEPDPVRSGDACRRRSARGSRHVREASQRIDAHAGRQRTVADLDAVDPGIRDPGSGAVQGSLFIRISALFLPAVGGPA